MIIINKFNICKIYEDTNMRAACNYMYKTIQAFEIDQKLQRIELENKGIYLLDSKRIIDITDFTEYMVQKMLHDEKLVKVEISNCYQVEICNFRRFLYENLTPQSFYWKALKSIDNQHIDPSDIFMLFNTILSLLQSFSNTSSETIQRCLDLDIEPLDAKMIVSRAHWSLELVRKVLADPELNTIEISNKKQVDVSIFKKFIQQALYPERFQNKAA